MDFSKLRTGELIAGICGVLLLIVMFFSWYGIGGAIGQFAEAAGVDTNVNAWQAFDFIDILLFVTAIVAIGVAVLGATGRSVALPVAASVIVTVLGVIVTLLVLYRLINEPGDDQFVDIKFGAYLGFLVCLGVAVGGFLAMADEGTSLGKAAQQVQQAASGSPTGQAQAPPPAQPPPAQPEPGPSPGEAAPGTSSPPPPTPPPGDEPPRQGP
jgi:hypothetical protein